jgi:hypothetical protein
MAGLAVPGIGEMIIIDTMSALRLSLTFGALHIEIAAGEALSMKRIVSLYAFGAIVLG